MSLPFHHAAIYCETGGGGLTAPYVSTDEETGWEKSFTCGHTHESGESLHYEACRAQTERWLGGGGWATDDCALHQMWGAVKKLKYVMCRERSAANVATGRQQTEQRVETDPQSEWQLLTLTWMMATN